MRTKSLAILFCFLMVFSFVLAVRTQADDKNKKTVITVSEPLRIPGVTLQPGKYVFKLMDSLSDRHIVRVTNEDETKVIATILAIPNYRLEVTDKSEFQMWEVPAGQSAALRAWFYPGDNFGQEFAYPKGEAATIAADVPTISDEMAAKLSAEAKVEDPISEEFRTTTITAQTTTQTETQTQAQAQQVTPTETAEEKAAREERERLERERAEAERLEAERLQREREAAAAAQAQQQAAPPAQPSQQPAEPAEPVADELPDTASAFPLIGLLGLLSVGASAAIRFARR